jgi:hypothetical protein
MWHQGKRDERPRREIGTIDRAVHATSAWVWCSRPDGALCLSTTLQWQRKLRIPKDIDRRKRPLFMSKVSVTITARSHLIINREQRASYLLSLDECGETNIQHSKDSTKDRTTSSVHPRQFIPHRDDLTTLLAVAEEGRPLTLLDSLANSAGDITNSNVRYHNESTDESYERSLTQVCQ